MRSSCSVESKKKPETKLSQNTGYACLLRPWKTTSEEFLNSTQTITSAHPENRFIFALRFMAFPILTIVLYPLFIFGVGSDHFCIQGVWVIVLTYCLFCVGGSFHEAVHETLFLNPATNRTVGRAIGVFIGIPFTVFKETHRQHHACLNTPGDYELWPYSDPAKSLTFRRTFVWLDLCLGIVTAPWIYGRIYFSRDSALKPEVRNTIRMEYLSIVAVWLILLGGLVLILHRRGYDWQQFDPVWLLPLLLSPVLNTARKFVEHLGLTSRDPLLGTRTVVGGNWFSRLSRYLNFDIAVHGPHHRYPKARHFELAPRLRAYQQQHTEVHVPVFRSYLSAFLHTLPYLWKNPATGDHTAVSSSQNIA
jgi:fatty acid desaturase